MDVPDLRQKILLELPTEDLINLCSTDKSYREMCDGYDFWSQKFANEGLLMLNKRTDAEGWIIEYMYSSICAHKAGGVLSMVADPEFTRNNGELMFDIGSPLILDAIQVVVNLSEATNYLLSLCLDRMTNPGDIRGAAHNTSVLYDKGVYYIAIYDMFSLRLTYKYKIPISKETAYKIIYVLYYYGIMRFLVNTPHSIMDEPEWRYGVIIGKDGSV